MWIGEHKLVLPPGTICDPLRSGYGPSEWDAPCARITRPVTITARASVNQAGRARVDFSPALRFRPNTMGEVVSLFLLDREAASSDGFTILYCADSGACVDDAATDPSVGTLVEPSTGFIFRRLKHFSGYTIGVGRSHDLSEEY